MPVFHGAEVHIWLRTPPRPAAFGGRRWRFFPIYGWAPIRGILSVARDSPNTTMATAIQARPSRLKNTKALVNRPRLSQYNAITLQPYRCPTPTTITLLLIGVLVVHQHIEGIAKVRGFRLVN